MKTFIHVTCNICGAKAMFCGFVNYFPCSHKDYRSRLPTQEEIEFAMNGPLDHRRNKKRVVSRET